MTVLPTAIDVPTEALRHCRVLTRRRARNFYYGLRLLPEPQRSALYAIYAWMREADDIADGDEEPRTSGAGPDGEGRLERLDAFRAATEAALVGRPEPGRMWEAFSYAAARFELPAEPFHEMIEGQRDDLQERRYETFEELRDYCCKVASTVGLVCIEVWGYSDPRARDLAIDRGIALQLTNIIRDFAADYDEGRVYLPRCDFAAADLTPEAVRNWRDPKACRVFMLEQISRAEEHFRRSAPLDDLIAQACRPTLRAMTGIYHGLLRKAAADPARLVERRLRLSPMVKARIALRARWR